MSEEVSDLADQLWAGARDTEQAVCRVPDDEVAAAVRARVRRLAADEGVRIRTARLAELVAVVRLDAAIWTQDAATMRSKLRPTTEATDGTS